MSYLDYSAIREDTIDGRHLSETRIIEDRF